ncbi:TPA: hypothetical protein DCE37_05850 [Candidatus Latescibacteria bacterium]|nr:hypothetical protein [Candidatus Latescibacterota bacterium]
MASSWAEYSSRRGRGYRRGREVALAFGGFFDLTPDGSADRGGDDAFEFVDASGADREVLGEDS